MYYAWGETIGYNSEQVPVVRAFTEDEYKKGPAASISADLTLEQDAAHVNLGGNWRMPTKDECQELLDNCDDSWTDGYNGTGVAGWVLTSTVNGKSVFFPAAGDCSDSNVYGVGSNGEYQSAMRDSTKLAWFLAFGSMGHNVASSPRRQGRSVRGVFK